jgi:O-antigen/teichoic acid export membrane protein
LSTTLKSKALGAVVWSAAENLSSQGARFVIGIILARLLRPDEFGLIGMLAIFISIARMIADCGFGQALIQKQDATRRDESSVFYVSLVLGFLGATTLFLAAPLIAAFYRQPQLLSLTRIMAWLVFINAFGVIQTNLLTKKMDFKTQLKVSVVSTLVGGIVAIIMAARGCGVISLAVQVLVGDSLRTVLLWLAHGWRPAAEFSFASVRKMFSFSSRLLASYFLNAIFQNIYSLLIGKIFDARALGFYSRAKNMQQLPAESLSSIVNRVSFPLFSVVQGDKPHLKRAVRKALTSVAFINFPLLTGLACVSAPLVKILLTDKWLPCVPLLQLLCGAGVLYPLHVIHLSALIAQGRSDLYFRLEVMKKCLVVVGILLTFHWGVKAMILGEVAVSIVCYFLNAFYTVRLISYSWLEQLQDLLPYLALSVAMGSVVMSVKLLAIESDLALLSVQVATGVLMYWAGCHLWRLSAFLETKGAIRSSSASILGLRL